MTMPLYVENRKFDQKELQAFVFRYLLAADVIRECWPVFGVQLLNKSDAWCIIHTAQLDYFAPLEICCAVPSLRGRAVACPLISHPPKAGAENMGAPLADQTMDSWEGSAT